MTGNLIPCSAWQPAKHVFWDHRLKDWVQIRDPYSLTDEDARRLIRQDADAQRAFSQRRLTGYTAWGALLAVIIDLGS